MSDPMVVPDPVLLDGGVATELQRAGLSVRAPWWATRALLTEVNRNVLRAVHEAYVGAGADVITANTFRANLRTLRETALDGAGQAWMVHAAVGVAQAARNESGRPDTLVAGSIGPAADCYRPDLVAPDDELRAEHRWLVEQLSRSGVDLYLIETMNTAREARIALAQALAAGGKAWVGFVCADGEHLLSGEELAQAARSVWQDGARAVLVNCVSPEVAETALRVLADAVPGPVGVCPNIEDRSGLGPAEHVDRYLAPTMAPAEFADLLAHWVTDCGARIVGGCCGTTPAHIAAARAAVPSRSTVPDRG